MIGNPKAIETLYKGYRFRSRLEAKWAVFFSALDLDWVYEPQGYVLPLGNYLPDFFINQWDCHIEIKPTIYFEDLNAAVGLCANLSNHLNKTTILLMGQPWPHEHEAFVIRPDQDEFQRWERGFYSFTECRHCSTAGLTKGDDGQHMFGDCCDYSTSLIGVSSRAQGRIMGAYRIARSARFEHGESP